MKHQNFIRGYPCPETPGDCPVVGMGSLASGMRLGVLPIHDDHPSGGLAARAEELARCSTVPEGTCEGDGQDSDGEE